MKHKYEDNLRPTIANSRNKEEDNSHRVSLLEKELFRIKNQLQTLSAELINERQQNRDLKNAFQRKQDVATRLLGQRNSARFFGDRIVQILRVALTNTNSKVSREASALEMANALVEIAQSTWNGQKEIVLEKNLLKERLDHVTNQYNSIQIDMEDTMKTVLSYMKKYGPLSERDMISSEDPSFLKSKKNQKDKAVKYGVLGKKPNYILSGFENEINGTGEYNDEEPSSIGANLASLAHPAVPQPFNYQTAAPITVNSNQYNWSEISHSTEEEEEEIV